MSAFNQMQPFAAPQQKQMLLDRLMNQYQQSANRAQGLQRPGPITSPLHSMFSMPGPFMPVSIAAPRQTAMPQAHPFIPVRIGGAQ